MTVQTAALPLVEHPRRKPSLRRRLVQLAFARLLRRTQATLVADGQLPLLGIHRILVCRPNHRLGNMLLLTPLVAEIERVYPGAEIHLLLGAGSAAEIFSNYRSVRQVHCLTARMARHPWLLLTTLRRLRGLCFDLGVDASLDSQSARIFIALARARHMVGLHDTTGGIVDVQRQHFAERAVRALWRALPPGMSAGNSCPPLSIRLSAQEVADAGHDLWRLTRCRSSSTHVLVGVFANATGAKKLDAAWWNAFIAHTHLLRPDFRIVEFLPVHAQSMLACRYTTYYSTQLRQMAALMSQLSCFVSADCGVMHLAAASGVPTYGLFSTTDADVYGPYGNGSCSYRVTDRSPQDIARCVVKSVERRLAVTH